MVKGSILVWLVLYNVFPKPHLMRTELPEINRLRLEGGLQQPAQRAPATQHATLDRGHEQ